VLNHLQALYAFYGEGKGLRIARKHLGWYSQNHADAAEFRRLAFAADSADQQWQITQRWYQQLQETATQNPNPQNQNRATPPKLAA
jgi:tRNA-dihydrouridine synthase B